MFAEGKEGERERAKEGIRKWEITVLEQIRHSHHECQPDYSDQDHRVFEQGEQ